MKAINLGSSNVLSTVLKLIIPAVIAQFINVLYSIVDRMFVGNIETIGDTALAAVGVYNVAGERAGARVNAPASFQVAFLDELYLATPEDIAHHTFEIEEA